MTLTLGKVGNVFRAKKDLVASWNRLRLRIQRSFGQFSYLRVPELGSKNGRLHLHALINVYIPQAWLSRNAEECGFGRVCDIRAVNTKHAVKYTLKYLEKSAESPEMLKFAKLTHLRRYSFSRDIPPETREKSPWQVVKRMFRSRMTPQEKALCFGDTPQNGAVIRTKSASGSVVTDIFCAPWVQQDVDDALEMWKLDINTPRETNELAGFNLLNARTEDNAVIDEDFPLPRLTPEEQAEIDKEIASVEIFETEKVTILPAYSIDEDWDYPW